MPRSHESCAGPPGSAGERHRRGRAAARAASRSFVVVASAAPGWLDRALATGAVVALAAYRGLLSPLLGRNCRFEPSCSAYASEALARYGFARGAWMAVRRLVRCHPWNPGGYDPVAPGGAHSRG